MPDKISEIEQRFTNRELNDAKEVLDYLARERQYADTMTKVQISRLQRQFRDLYEPVNDAIQDIIEEHGEGDPGEKSIKPNTPAMRAYVKAVNELMKRGETAATFVPLPLESLVVKRRGPDGARQDEVVDLSPEELNKLGPLIRFEAGE